MKSLTLVAIIILATVSVSFTQEKEEYSKWEIYGGYSTARDQRSAAGSPFGSFLETKEKQGYEVSVTRNLTRNFGLKFDYSRNSSSGRATFLAPGNLTKDLDFKNSSHFYTAGIQVKDNSVKGRIKPFAHALFGGVSASTTTSVAVCAEPVCAVPEKKNYFTMIFGGGVDVKVNRRFSVRPIQVDYIRVNNSDQPSGFFPRSIERNNVRVGAGVVFHADSAEIERSSKPNNYSKYEIHIGYTYNKFKEFKLESGMPMKFKDLNGYNASIKWNFQRFLGAEFEISAGWAGNERITIPGQDPVTFKRSIETYAGGIQVKDNSTKTRVKPFGHALFGFGVGKLKTTGNFGVPTLTLHISDSDFMMIFGGGLDIKLNNRFSVRAFQFDYLHPRRPIPQSGRLDNIYRFGAGIVFH